MKFSELSLSEKLLKAIEAAGYSEATPIQEKAIPAALEGRDVLGIAQTGTGKTGAFVLPMIARLEQGRARARMPRSLILAPTRELAAQVSENFETLGANHKLSMALLIGGVSFDKQAAIIDRGADVLIATPGRLLDHMQRGKLMLNAIDILVIDEADRMLDMGFIPDIEKIIKMLPFTRQTLFFSATMPPVIQKLVRDFLHNPERVEVAQQSTTAKTITQKFQSIRSKTPADKRDVLRGLLKTEEVRNAIIFCNRKRDVGILQRSLEKHGFNAGALHGDMDQHSRMKTLAAFKNDEIKLLCASDVAARGLDIPNVSHVFNFDIPRHAEDYVHRIGRTGRAGKKGHAISLITSADKEDLKAIFDLCKIENPTWIDGEPEASDDRKTGERKRRSRNSKTRNKDAAPRDQSQTASPETGPQPTQDNTRKQSENDNASELPAKTISKEKEAPKSQSPAPAKPERKPHPTPNRGRNKGRKGSGEVIGMGDHVPAFMTKSVKSIR
ncbi:MAG: DEAD/DEAH box helicase [Hyphomicrobiaceae bacterium]|nr:DEAD/DEAH box helicase [Hyphomicrobiaceae bacterium]